MSKIIFVGAQGTGKTTMNNIISSYLPDYRVIDSMSEKFFKKDFFKDVNSDRYLRAQIDIYNYASSEYLQNADIISSRGFADSYGYVKHSLDQTGKEEFREIIRRIFLDQEALLKQDVVHFYFPIEFDIESKELRSTNKEFQEKTDKNILKFLKMTDTPFYEVRGTVEDREKYILKILKARKII